MLEKIADVYFPKFTFQLVKIYTWQQLVLFHETVLLLQQRKEEFRKFWNPFSEENTSELCGVFCFVHLSKSWRFEVEQTNKRHIWLKKNANETPSLRQEISLWFGNFTQTVVLIRQIPLCHFRQLRGAYRGEQSVSTSGVGVSDKWRESVKLPMLGCLGYSKSPSDNWKTPSDWLLYGNRTCTNT